MFDYRAIPSYDQAIGLQMDQSAGPECDVEPVVAYVQNGAELTAACQGCAAVFCLVHSMGRPGFSFTAADRDGTVNMVALSAEAGVKCVLCLGGLGEKHKLPILTFCDFQKNL